MRVVSIVCEPVRVENAAIAAFLRDVDSYLLGEITPEQIKASHSVETMKASGMGSVSYHRLQEQDMGKNGKHLLSSVALEIAIGKPLHVATEEEVTSAAKAHFLANKPRAKGGSSGIGKSKMFAFRAKPEYFEDLALPSALGHWEAAKAYAKVKGVL